MKFHLVFESGNAKTGPIPVTTSSSETCSSKCPLKNKGCYANSGNLAFHWRKVSQEKRGDDFNVFVKKLSDLPFNQLVRLNQAGDLPGKNDRINGKMLDKVVKAGQNKKFFTYTHKNCLGNSYVAKQNKKHVKEANRNGVTINLSGNNLTHADKLKKLNIAPVVCIIPIGSPDTLYTPAGNKVIKCPAQSRDNVTCKSCQLCQKVNRSVMVGFESHGIQKGKVNLIANNY